MEKDGKGVKKMKPIMERSEGRWLLNIDGEYYAWDTQKPSKDHKGHVDHVTLKKVDKEEYDNYIEGVVDKLFEHIDRKAVVRSTLRNLDLSEIRKIEKLMTKHKPEQVKGCYGLKFGNYELEIVE